MAAAPHPQRDEAILTIRNMVAFHGRAEGERLARAKYSDIAKGTFSGWLKQARLPAEPPSLVMPAARASGSFGGDAAPLSFEARIAKIDSHVAMIVAQCTSEVVDPVTGARTAKAKNPVVLAQAVRLQASAAELLAKWAQTAWNQGKMEELYQQVIDAVGEVDRGLQQAVLTRLRGLKEQREGAAALGIGVAPATGEGDI